MGTSILRMGVLKNWAGFAGAWATAAAIALTVHAAGAGGLGLLGAGQSGGMARDLGRVSQAEALHVRILERSLGMDLLGIPKELPQVHSDRSMGAGREKAFAQLDAGTANGLSPNVAAIAESDLVEAGDTKMTNDKMEASDALRPVTGSAEAGPEGVERCTNLSSLISRELWLEFRDYGILPRTYKVAYARQSTGETQLLRFEPVHAQTFEYADRMLSGIMQRCMSDLRKLPSHGDLEVTFVIGDERL
jgi:hypothetical protein